MSDPFELVRKTCEATSRQASSIVINVSAILSVSDRITSSSSSKGWDFDEVHFNDGGDNTVQYLLVLDTLNLCFWPDEELHYSSLAKGLKRSLEGNPGILDAKRLSNCSAIDVRHLVHWSRELPLEEKRRKLLNEVGKGLADKFGGLASNLVLAANGSASTLVHLLLTHFPGFRDQSPYRGSTVFHYKRAQIFVADVWGAFKGEGLGRFSDIENLTMFADYVVPAVLRDWGILEYAPQLANLIDSGKEISAGSEEEVELRSCCITATEVLKNSLQERGTKWNSIQLDWYLWSEGVETDLKHHKTLTTFY